MSTDRVGVTGNLVVESGPAMISIQNIVVRGSSWTPRDIQLLFGVTEPVHFTEARDLPNLLVELQVFPSTSKARQAGREGPIPFGWTELKASKKRRIWIWNPTTVVEEIP